MESYKESQNQPHVWKYFSPPVFIQEAMRNDVVWNKWFLKTIGVGLVTLLMYIFGIEYMYSSVFHQIKVDLESTQNTTSNILYKHIQKVTGVIDKKHISDIKESIKKYNLDEKVDVYQLSNLQKASYPCLIPPPLRIRYNETWNGYSLPIITSTDIGRLGNKMGDYASLLALGRLYNVSVVIHPEMEKNLRKIFPYLSMPKLSEEDSRNDWTTLECIPPTRVNYSPAELASAGLFGPKKFYLAYYPYRMNLFNFIRDEVVAEFKFAEVYAEKVHIFLNNVRTNMIKKWKTDDITFIGLHIRRTDYITHIKNYEGILPEITYFDDAIQYYRKKFSHPVFIASSDDGDYLTSFAETKEDVFMVPNYDGETAMAILSSCNHSIISPGSFSFWSGYLTGGEVVFPDCKCKQPYVFSGQSYKEARLHNFHPLDI